MNTRTDIHPDAVLESLLAKGGRSHRRANLARMHELCRRQHEAGGRDFSLPSVGRLAEAEGIMKGRALYNTQSADYRELILGLVSLCWAVCTQNAKGAGES
ncbi:gamma-mobile-trio protein GmtX [Ralstonia solanacearum]|uniref:gamma-mobile-trio protein GmtX n=1 Tax=Ralstonia solanacearum TaxID=305 RepID=UPI003CC56D57